MKSSQPNFETSSELVGSKRPVSRRRFIASVGAMASLAGCPDGQGSDATPKGTLVDRERIVVNAERGSQDGIGTAEDPYDTIMRGIENADPGDTVHVKPGEYAEPVVPPRGGEPGSPITITGPPDAVLTSDRTRFQPLKIHDSHIHLRGLTIDGLWDPDNLDDPESYATSPLVDVEPPPESDEYLEDIIIAPHGIGNASWALVVIRRAKNVEIGPFRVTGLAGANYVLDENVSRHAGEIVYLGTPPSTYSREDDYPWDDLDQTRNVHVHHIDNSAGYPHSELVNTKLGTRNILIEYCTDGGGSQNAESYPTGSVRFQSYDATLRWCDLQNGSGHGVIIMEAGDTWLTEKFEGRIAEPFDLDRLGTGHTVQGNLIGGFQEAAIKLQWASPDEQTICGNDVRGDILDQAGEHFPQDECPEDLTEGDGIGHTGGNSPWE